MSSSRGFGNDRQGAESRLWRVLETAAGDRFRITIGRIGATRFAAEPFRPVLALGPQRSRKTTSIVVPNLLEWDGPAVVTSVREDVIEQTISHRRKLGKVCVFDPGDAVASWQSDKLGWNPLDLVGSWDDAKRVAAALTEAGRHLSGAGLQDGNFWHHAAEQLLAPHIFAASDNPNLSMRDVMRWVKNQEEFEVRSLLQAKGVDLAIEAAEAAWSREDRARSSIYTTLQIDMDVWDRESVLAASSAPDRFRIDEFLDGESNTVYLCAPPDAQEEYSPIFTAVIRSVLRAVYRKNAGFMSSLLGIEGVDAAMTSSPGVVPMLLLLDEAGNIAPLENMSSIATTAAGTAIQLVTIFHDISQLSAIYGSASAVSIVNNHSALVVLPGNRDPATANLVVGMLGKEKVYGWLNEIPTSSSIRRLAPGTALCVYENLPPVVIELRSSLTDKELLAYRTDAQANESEI